MRDARAPERGVDHHPPVRDHPVQHLNSWREPMNTPMPSRRVSADDRRIRAWIELRRELAEMHARLEYLKLLLRLRVKR